MSDYIIVSGRMRPGLHPLGVAPGSQGLRRALITYDGLPSGPHSLGQQSAVKVWRSISGFLADCASVLHQGQELSAYGLGRKPPYGEMRENAFALRPDQVANAVEWAVSHRSIPPIDLGYGWVWPSLQVGLNVLFTLVDPRTGATLPYQGAEHYGGQGFDGYCASGLGESRMYVELTNGKSRCYVALSFPFEDATEEFWAYVEELQRRLPFKLSDEHWQRRQLNKAGTAYYRRKVRPPRG